MGSILFGFKSEMETKNKFKYDTITRPKYSRRILHLEQPSKGGTRRKYGGSTADWTNIRKGDYVEAAQVEKAFRCWVSGYIDDKRLISVSNFDWMRVGQFGESNIKILNRNTGLLLKIEKVMTMQELVNQRTGTIQLGIEDAWR
jgi:hypothetical protein